VWAKISNQAKEKACDTQTSQGRVKMNADKSSLASISQFELSPFVTGNIKKSRAVTKQTFESVMNQEQEKATTYISIPVYLSQQRPLPDGTGQILNIGI
jgi:hypothetical protein